MIIIIHELICYKYFIVLNTTTHTVKQLDKCTLQLQSILITSHTYITQYISLQTVVSSSTVISAIFISTGFTRRTRLTQSQSFLISISTIRTDLRTGQRGLAVISYRAIETCCPITILSSLQYKYIYIYQQRNY